METNFMEVRGSNFSKYDAQHIAHVQREIARSVKPNLLRQLEDDDLEDAVFHRLLAEDLVDLSPEAKELLQSLRKDRLQRKGKKQNPEESNKDFLSLLTSLDELRQEVEAAREQEDPVFTRPGQPFVPPTLVLSQHVPRPERVPGSSSQEYSGPYLNRAGELARKLVAISPSPELRDILAWELQVFGEEIVSMVKQFGVRAIILDRHSALTDIKIQGMTVVAPSEKTFDGRPWSQVRGLYCSDRRLFVVGEELIGLPHMSVARHEFAHAYDHVFSQKNGRRLPLSVQLWNRFCKERTALVSRYAGTNPAEYFAESVEAFFRDGPRELLRQEDPLMFDYLCQLFAA